MKKTLSILMVSIFCFLTIDAKAENAIPTDDTFHLRGKIINQVKLPPGCGHLALATVVEFEIMEFSYKNYKNKEVGIIFPCPEFYGKGFFEKGKLYDVTVSEKSGANFSYGIFNEELLKKYKTPTYLWAKGATRIF